jgi:DNA-binding XRE family transcriptional regulator
MERDWARFGDTVARERNARRLTQVELAEAVGVKRATIQGIEGGKPYAKIALVHRALARYFGWTDDSVEQVLAGSDPTPAETSPAPGTPAHDAPAGPGLPEGLSERARATLQDGRVVETDVIDDPTDPLGGVVLIRTRSDGRVLTKEEMRRDWKRWAELQRMARQIFAEPDDETDET